MALEITGNIELGNGLSVSSCYSRTNFQLRENGVQVLIFLDTWNSQTDYENGKYPFADNVFPLESLYDYDRTTDGSDLLDFSNQVIKSQLEAQGYSVVITEL